MTSKFPDGQVATTRKLSICWAVVPYYFDYKLIIIVWTLFFIMTSLILIASLCCKLFPPLFFFWQHWQDVWFVYIAIFSPLDHLASCYHRCLQIPHKNTPKTHKLSCSWAVLLLPSSLWCSILQSFILQTLSFLMTQTYSVSNNILLVFHPLLLSFNQSWVPYLSGTLETMDHHWSRSCDFHSSVIHSHPVSDVSEPGVPWSSSSLLPSTVHSSNKCWYSYLSPLEYGHNNICTYFFITFKSCRLTFKPIISSFKYVIK